MTDTLEYITQEMSITRNSNINKYIWLPDKDSNVLRINLIEKLIPLGSPNPVRGSVTYNDSECYDPFIWEVDTPSESRINSEPLIGRMPKLSSAKSIVEDLLNLTLAFSRATPLVRNIKIGRYIELIKSTSRFFTYHTGNIKVDLEFRARSMEEAIMILYLFTLKCNSVYKGTVNSSGLMEETVMEHYGVNPDGEIFYPPNIGWYYVRIIMSKKTSKFLVRSFLTIHEENTGQTYKFDYMNSEVVPINEDEVTQLNLSINNNPIPVPQGIIQEVATPFATFAVEPTSLWANILTTPVSATNVAISSADIATPFGDFDVEEHP